MMVFARTDRSPLARWVRTVDWWTLAAVAVLASIGLVLSLAAGPVMAARLDYDSYHFFWRHLVFLAPAAAVLIGVSLLRPRDVLRLAAVIVVVGFIALLATLVIGIEVKGARRWLSLGALSLQPSEFVKPAFIVLSAWFFARWNEVPGYPGSMIALVLYAVFATLLMLQPDVGQTLLITAVWSGLFFIAGVPLAWTAVIAAAGVGFGVAAYAMVPHVRLRIDQFLSSDSDGTGQVDRALEALRSGGLLGRGPGEGTVKFHIPDAHTDFVFAVAGEEFGLITCFLIAVLFAIIVGRALAHAFKERDHFIQLAVAGLAMLFGLQAIINIGVNLGMLPAKGMTLPFISYGGSSLVALGLTVGMMLALMRPRIGSGLFGRA
jgi:cell division protein FtsW